MSETIAIVDNTALHGMFEQEIRQENQTTMLRFLAGMYLNTSINSDYQARFTSSSAAFDGGSVDGVRLFFHPDFIKRNSNDWGSPNTDTFRSRLASRSTKPKMLILLNQMPRTGHYPDDPRKDYLAGNFQRNTTAVNIMENGIHLGCLCLTTGSRHTYRLYVYDNPMIHNTTGQTQLDIEALRKIEVLTRRAVEVINDRFKQGATGNITFVDIMRYATEVETEFMGVTSEFDVSVISRRQVGERVRNLHIEHKALLDRTVASARNCSLAQLELTRLETSDRNIIDLNKVEHPFIDMVYVEEATGGHYPIIRVLTKLMAFMPDGGTEGIRGYEKEIGVPVGKFTITINFNTEQVVSFKNNSYNTGVDGYSSNMHHPHIFSAGDACWGNFGESLSDLIMQFDMIGLIDLAMLFIQQANYRDAAGHEWAKWTRTNNYPTLLTEYKEQMVQLEQEAA